MKITTDLIAKYYPSKIVSDAIESEGGDLVSVMCKLPVQYALWLVLHEEFIPGPQLRELACRYSQDVLSIFEAQYPEDKRPRMAIEAKRAWLRNDTWHYSLAKAVNGAYEASMSVSKPAYYAAFSVVCTDDAGPEAMHAAIYACRAFSPDEVAQDDACKRYLKWAIEQMEAAQNGRE
jgi:hypothetical protein